MARFINPFTDMGFKRIFGQAINKDLLIDFLNALLEGERSIKDITFLDKELLPVYREDRGVIYDIYCTDENGEQFIVEMQNQEQINFRERALYYLSQTIARQGEKGPNWKFELKSVYGVFFMNFKLKGSAHKLRTDIVLADRDTHELFTDKMRYIFLELPAFTKEEDECENDFERWIYVLKKIVDIASLSKEDRMKYDESIKVYRDNLAVRAFAVEEGRAEGREIGRAEERQKIALGMKKEGVSVEIIAKFTGLTPEEIAVL